MAHVDDALGELSAVLLLDVLNVRVVLVHHSLGVDRTDDDCRKEAETRISGWDGGREVSRRPARLGPPPGPPSRG